MIRPSRSFFCTTVSSIIIQYDPFGYLYLMYVNYTKKREERDAFCEINRDFVKVLFLLRLLQGLMKGIRRGRGKASL